MATLASTSAIAEETSGLDTTQHNELINANVGLFDASNVNEDELST